MIIVWILRAVAFACVALGAFAILTGYVPQGLVMLVNAGTFTVLSFTAKWQHENKRYLDAQRRRGFER